MCDPITATAIGVGSLAASGYGAYNAHQMRGDAKAAAGKEEARVLLAQQQRDKNLGTVREAYGVGNTATAKNNARTLAQSVQDYYQQYLGNSLRTADDQYAASSRTSRQNLARVGQLGSSLDASSRSGTLSDYLRARQKAVSAAGDAKNSLQNSLTAQRLSLENQINGGTMTSPDTAAMLAQQRAAINSAQSQIAPTALGSLFNTAGNTYFQGKTQEAYGNQGLQAFNLGNDKQRGSIT